MDNNIEMSYNFKKSRTKKHQDYNETVGLVTLPLSPKSSENFQLFSFNSVDFVPIVTT